MTVDKLIDSIGEIDDEYIEDERMAGKTNTKLRSIFQYGFVASVGIVLLLVGATIGGAIGSNRNLPIQDDLPKEGEETIEPIDGNVYGASFRILVSGSSASNHGEQMELTLQKAIEIAGDFNPMMSSSSGIGVRLSFDYSGEVILSADGGAFYEWNQVNGEGPVIEKGNRITIDGKDDIYCAPEDLRESADQMTVRVKFMDGEHIVGLALLTFSEGTSKGTIVAKLAKLRAFPTENGVYQDVLEDYERSFFEE